MQFVCFYSFSALNDIWKGKRGGGQTPWCSIWQTPSYDSKITWRCTYVHPFFRRINCIFILNYQHNCHNFYKFVSSEFFSFDQLIYFYHLPFASLSPSFTLCLSLSLFQSRLISKRGLLRRKSGFTICLYWSSRRTRQLWKGLITRWLVCFLPLYADNLNPICRNSYILTTLTFVWCPRLFLYHQYLHLSPLHRSIKTFTLHFTPFSLSLSNYLIHLLFHILNFTTNFFLISSPFWHPP